MIETKNNRSLKLPRPNRDGDWTFNDLVELAPTIFGGVLNRGPRRSFSEEVEKLSKELESAFESSTAQTYPHYDIINHGDDQYSVDVAVAGFKKAELEITVSNGTLTVRGEHIKDEDQPKVNYIRQGIAKRKFTLELRIGDSVKVVGAELDGGMLHIDLLREVPEEKKPKTIMIK